MNLRGAAQKLLELKKGPYRIAEIGVLSGENARSFLEGLDIELLVLVDPYLPYMDGQYPISQERMDSAFNNTAKVIKEYKEKIVWVPRKSENAHYIFPDRFFDLVYIDGNHIYPFVKTDVECWNKKVKIGGIFGGHDFDKAADPFVGVSKAVYEFIEANGLTLIEGIFPDWAVIIK